MWAVSRVLCSDPFAHPRFSTQIGLNIPHVLCTMLPGFQRPNSSAHQFDEGLALYGLMPYAPTILPKRTVQFYAWIY